MSVIGFFALLSLGYFILLSSGPFLCLFGCLLRLCCARHFVYSLIAWYLGKHSPGCIRGPFFAGGCWGFAAVVQRCGDDTVSYVHICFIVQPLAVFRWMHVFQRNAVRRIQLVSIASRPFILPGDCLLLPHDGGKRVLTVGSCQLILFGGMYFICVSAGALHFVSLLALRRAFNCFFRALLARARVFLVNRGLAPPSE